MSIPTQLVAQPAPMAVIVAPAGTYFDEAMTLPFCSVSVPPLGIGPQFPCSPHPHAMTSPSSVNAKSVLSAVNSQELAAHDRSGPSSQHSHHH
jgi:hypothetical protein